MRGRSRWSGRTPAWTGCTERRRRSPSSDPSSGNNRPSRSTPPSATRSRDMPPRTLRPGQRAELHVIDVTTGERELVYSSSTLLFEAPNWTPDGASLVINGDGLLFRVPASGGAEPKEIPLGGIPPINNDHVLSPDGRMVYVLSLIHISEPTRLGMISYAVFCLKK